MHAENVAQQADYHHHVCHKKMAADHFCHNKPPTHPTPSQSLSILRPWCNNVHAH